VSRKLINQLCIAIYLRTYFDTHSIDEQVTVRRRGPFY